MTLTKLSQDFFSEKYLEDNFYLELGKFLTKGEVKEELERHELQNRNDDLLSLIVLVFMEHLLHGHR